MVRQTLPQRKCFTYCIREKYPIATKWKDIWNQQNGWTFEINHHPFCWPHPLQDVLVHYLGWALRVLGSASSLPEIRSAFTLKSLFDPILFGCASGYLWLSTCKVGQNGSMDQPSPIFFTTFHNTISETHINKSNKTQPKILRLKTWKKTILKYLKWTSFLDEANRCQISGPRCSPTPASAGRRSSLGDPVFFRSPCNSIPSIPHMRLIWYK